MQTQARSHVTPMETQARSHVTPMQTQAAFTRNSNANTRANMRKAVVHTTSMCIWSSYTIWRICHASLSSVCPFRCNCAFVCNVNMETNAKASARKWNFFHSLRRRLRLSHSSLGSLHVRLLVLKLAFAFAWVAPQTDQPYCSRGA